jgi:5-keto-L-gluconate epimerase
MKVALAVAPSEAQPSAFVVFRDRLEITIPKAARLGYDAIELALADPADVDVRAVCSLLDANGTCVVAVSTGRVFSERRVWLTHPDPSTRRLAIDIIRALVDTAAELGAGMVNIGRVRGLVHEGETRDVAEGRLFEGIRECAGYGARQGVAIILEPVNRYEINYVNSVVPDGIEMLERLDCPNVKLMPDVFHMNIEDASIADSLKRADGRIGYVHLADSNRWAPGRGHLDFAAVFDALASISYDGAVGVEILPYPTADQAAADAIRFLRNYVPADTAVGPS